MTLGRAIYLLYHRPLGRIRTCIRNGGPGAERETERERRTMEAAAARLGPLPTHATPLPTVHLMTGKRFWFQTAFCLHTLAHVTQRTVSAELYDDGSLDRNFTELLNQLGPTVKIRRADDSRNRLDQFLPASRFPTLWERWQNYPNIRKLIDVHLDGTGWKLVLDSDLLFFRAPIALTAWLDAPDQILHAVDSEESYGYSRSLMEELAGAKIPPLLNVGICGLNSSNIDWALLERWTAELQRRERTSYYLEQALVAMLVAREGGIAAPAGDYITFPRRQEVEHPTAVMHHYVATSKRWYYRYGWRAAAGETVTTLSHRVEKPRHRE